jgi:hypothetical protein
MDDALMFVRYADSLWEGRGMEWNPEQGPVYGATSQLYVFAVALFRPLLADPIHAVIIPGLACWLVFLLLAWKLAGSIIQSTGARCLILTAAIPATYTLSLNMLTGMDTGLAAAWLVGLLLASRLGQNHWRIIVWSILGGLAWMARPELGLFGLGVPLVAALMGNRQAWRPFIGSILVFLASIAVVGWHYGSLIPLPFLAKSVDTLISGSAIGIFRLLAGDVFLDFLVLALLPLFISALGFHRPNWGTGKAEAWIGAATFLLLYIALSVLPVMGNYARFYIVLAPVIFAAALMGSKRIEATFQMPWSSRGIMAAALISACLPIGVGVQGLKSGLPTFSLNNTSIEADLSRFAPQFWVGIAEAASVEPGLSVATTEVGRPSVLFPVVIDLVGLNDRSIALKESTPLAKVLDMQPDIVWLPISSYPEMLNSFKDSPEFRNQYSVWLPGEIGAHLGVAVRKNGRGEAIIPILEEAAQAHQTRITSSWAR